MKGKKADVKGISLVICAKNELNQLQKFIPIWLEQEGINFEIIVVNDNSADDSHILLDSFAQQNEHFKTKHLYGADNTGLKGKRAALLAGVKIARYDFIALSDADCFPSSKNHLFEMASAFLESTDVVLGYSPYVKTKGFLGHVLTYETTLTALQYLSFAKIGMPYMGVGRNLAYRKSKLTNEVFEKSNIANGGDDDLIIAQVAKKENTQIQLNANTFVYSLAPQNWMEYFKQKQRHYSTAKHYSLSKILLVGAFGALNILFYITLFTLLIIQVNVFLVLSLYLCKLLLFVVLNYNNLTKLKVKTNLKTIWYIDLVFTFIFLFNHIKALRGKHGWER